MSGFYFTGTGWPNADQDQADLDLITRAFAVTRAVRHEASLRELRQILGLDPGQAMRDAIPLSRRVRDDIDAIYGPSLPVMPAEWLIARLNDTMRDADARLVETVPVTAAQETCLYRFHDEAGRLLYVGVAYDPDAREKQHRHSQRWAPLIAAREDEWFDTREDALRAETHAIRNESPLFNEAGRPRLPSLEGEVFA